MARSNQNDVLYLSRFIKFIRKRGKGVGMVDRVIGKRGKSRRLFDILSKGDFDDRSEVCQKLYGKGEDAKFPKAKTMLKDQLVRLVLADSYSERNYGEVNTIRLFTCGRILWMMGGRSLAVPLISKAFARARKREMAQTAFDAARLLRYYYGNIEGNRLQYRKFFRLSEQFRDIAAADNAYGALYERQSLKPGVDTEKLAPNCLKSELERLNQQYEGVNLSTRARFFRSILKIDELELGDQESHESRLRSLLIIFEDQENLPKTYLRLILYRMIKWAIARKSLVIGLELIKKLDQIADSFEIWLNSRELEVLMYTYTSQYGQASEILIRVEGAQPLKRMPLDTQENWLLIKAYLSLVEQLKSPDKEVRKLDFRLRRFLNSVAEKNKDKTGANFSVILLELLFLISMARYDKADLRLGSLQRYATRYGIRRMFPRGHLFILMLQNLSRVNYHRAAAQRVNAKYLRKLKKETDDQYTVFEWEVIPYVALWGLIVDNLSNSVK